MIGYISAREAAEKWGVSKRRVQTLCSSNRIENITTIGNCWAIPDHTAKPCDARMKKNKIIIGDTLRKTRSAIKSITVDVYKMMLSVLSSKKEAKMHTILFLSAMIYKYHNGTLDSGHIVESDEFNALENLVSGEFGKSMSVLERRVVKSDENLIFKFRLCIPHSDDLLSWAYQYLNDECADSSLSSTQFFTEKYMISALVDGNNIDDAILLDPACGGGNFLLYCLEKKYSSVDFSGQNDAEIVKKIEKLADSLRGYDIDRDLSIVADINIRLKIVELLKRHNICLTPTEMVNLRPNVFHPVDRSISGFLDRNDMSHRITDIKNADYQTLSDLIRNVDSIYTNPPFQTVKGMNDELKQFLKKNYPLCNCDLCNAFIERMMEIVPNHGLCCFVSQNSWMFLNSFKPFRKKILSTYPAKRVINLGSGSFYDISGEKTNISLITMSRGSVNNNKILVVDLSDLRREDKEMFLCGTGHDYKIRSTRTNQKTLIEENGTIKLTTDDFLDNLRQKSDFYGTYAVPMQGTSTGNSSKLVDYFWNRKTDPDWAEVSKGGGYSRWCGLNNYVVRWGVNGEFIQSTPGSAIRNVKYFEKTDLVFSDTGSSGLNVRLMRNNQKFIASGPGIRILTGDKFAHLAFLNSKYSSYVVKQLTPKLTISAGYIAKIPVTKSLLTSADMSYMGKRCYDLKKDSLELRPNNIEYSFPTPNDMQKKTDDLVEEIIRSEMRRELEKIITESEIDAEIEMRLELSQSNRKRIRDNIGSNPIEYNSFNVSIEKIDDMLGNLLRSDCTLKKTKVERGQIGSDGPLEFISRTEKCSPEILLSVILENINSMKKLRSKYRNLIIHNIVYNEIMKESIYPIALNRIVENAERMWSDVRKYDLKKWICDNFNSIHSEIFFNDPPCEYSVENKTFRRKNDERNDE